MEIGDVFVINKSDRDDADKVKAEVEYMLEFKEHNDDTVANPVVMTSAKLNEGVDQLISDTQTFVSGLNRTGLLESRRKTRIFKEIKRILAGKIDREINKFLLTNEEIDRWIQKVYKKKSSPYFLVNENFSAFLKEYTQK